MTVGRTLLFVACAAWSAELRLVSHDQPVYPQLAWVANVQGLVVLTYTIGADGVPQAIEVVRGHPLLLPLTTANLQSWRFAGDPTAERRRVEFEYVLTGQPEDYKVNEPPLVEFVGAEKVRISVQRFTVYSRSGCPGGSVNPPSEPLLGRDSFTIGFGPQRIQMFADGRVVRGNGASTIPLKRARVLLERFRTVEFWSLCDAYTRLGEDGGVLLLNVTIGGQSKHLTDHRQASPAWLRQMIREVTASLMKKR